MSPESRLLTGRGKIQCLRCTAKSSRTGVQCGRPALKSSKTQKCQYHGGRSTGPKTAGGKARIAAAHIPLQERIETVSDEADLQEVYESEGYVLYVACTRARDLLLVMGVHPVSELLADLQGK